MGFSINRFFHFFLINNKEKTIYNLCLKDSIKKTCFLKHNALHDLPDDLIVSELQATLDVV